MRISGWSSDVCSSELDGLALGGVQRRREGFLQQLLVTPLQRAVALAEVDGTALAVGPQLHLDVTRPPEVLFHVDFVVAEGRLGFRAREAVGRSEEHTSELQSLMRISYAGLCLKKNGRCQDNSPNG